MTAQLSHVFLAPCREYDRETISEVVDSIHNKAGHFSTLRGADVLLKPNLISGRGPGLSCSHPEFIAGVALWFKGQGARVKVGDSPALGTARSVCRSRGIDVALANLDVEIVELSTPVDRQLHCGRTVSLAAEALECDCFIGLPRVKAHNQMYVTLAVKNIFGIVKGVHKAMLHMTCDNSHARFSDVILSLVDILPPQFHLIDAIEVMSESGPIDGIPLSLNCIGGSVSPIALDTALLDVLQVDAEKSPLQVAAWEKKLKGSDLTKIHYPLSQPADFYGANFVAPASLNPIRFNPFRFVSGMVKRMGLKLKG